MSESPPRSSATIRRYCASMRTRVRTRQRLTSGLLPLLISIFSASTRRFRVGEMAA
jgi:hypothetical protein